MEGLAGADGSGALRSAPCYPNPIFLFPYLSDQHLRDVVQSEHPSVRRRRRRRSLLLRDLRRRAPHGPRARCRYRHPRGVPTVEGTFDFTVVARASTARSPPRARPTRSPWSAPSPSPPSLRSPTLGLDVLDRRSAGRPATPSGARRDLRARTRSRSPTSRWRAPHSKIRASIAAGRTATSPPPKGSAASLRAGMWDGDARDLLGARRGRLR
jgi:hypothetical protein